LSLTLSPGRTLELHHMSFTNRGGRLGLYRCLHAATGLFAGFHDAGGSQSPWCWRCIGRPHRVNAGRSDEDATTGSCLREPHHRRCEGRKLRYRCRPPFMTTTAPIDSCSSSLISGGHVMCAITGQRLSQPRSVCSLPCCGCLAWSMNISARPCDRAHLRTIYYAKSSCLLPEPQIKF
jgi:hypothetical protein